MNRRFMLTAMFTIALAVASAQALQHAKQTIDPGKSGTATVNIDKSEIEWRANKVVGKHRGTVDLRSGSFTFANGKLTGGRFEVNMTTIKNSDIENEATRAKLEGHLKSDDFFSTEKFPVAVFTITTASSIDGAKPGEDNYNITGDMKIKGLSRKISFPAMIDARDNTVRAKAALTLDRTRWDVKYGSGSFFDNLGDNMIRDEFTLELDVQATM